MRPHSPSPSIFLPFTKEMLEILPQHARNSFRGDRVDVSPFWQHASPALLHLTVRYNVFF
jgi:hypothetical protein